MSANRKSAAVKKKASPRKPAAAPNAPKAAEAKRPATAAGKTVKTSAPAKAAASTTTKAATSTKSAAGSSSPVTGSPIHGAQKAVDEQLARYRSMRNFGVTQEPSGETKAVASEAELPFVIQKHAATRLHYDFRLGWRGVLKSWAVAKGPSYSTKDKRLAVEVEDHPIEYGGFEGTIPKGQYGGGTVMLWDQGTWEPIGDVDESLKKGNLKFVLKGQKLEGKWVLVRMGGQAAKESKPNWLLIKEHDDFERPADDEAITDAEPNSVVTGRDLDQIAAAEDHVWQSKAAANTVSARTSPEAEMRERLKNKFQGAPQRPSAAPAVTQTSAEERRIAAKRQKAAAEVAGNPLGGPLLEETPTEIIRGFIEPQLATQATAPPEGPDWIHELKLDGYRVQIQLRAGADRVAIYTRNGLDWTHRMKDVADAMSALPVQTAVLDGEVVVLDANGHTSFAELQAAFQEHQRKPLVFFAFDLLHLNGHSLRSLPLLERKRLLQTLLSGADQRFVRYSEHIAVGGDRMFAEACKLGAEGIISKQAQGKYAPGRSKSWIKIKCIRRQEFVIGGFTPPGDGSKTGLGSVLLGLYEGGKLVYAGRAGTGFTQQSAAALRKRLEGMRRDAPPFAAITSDARKDALWVKPELVCEVAFATWTADSLVRQASFKGLREDKQAKDVRREIPLPTQAITHNKSDASEPDHPGESLLESAAAKTPAAPRQAASSQSAKSIRLTNPDKILDDESRLTKQQLLEYLIQVAPNMLPHIAHRPLTIVRCPEGSGKPCFFQKHISKGLPAGIETVNISDNSGGKPEPYITLSTPEALAGLAQMGVLELHPWSSCNETLEQPDCLIFDLDPDDAIEWSTLVTSAEEVRERLKKLGLKSFVKTTGGKGLHIVAPIQPKYDWAAIKAFSKAFATQMEDENVRLYLTKMTKAARKNKIYVDFLRNQRGATAVAPYSPRARRGCTVAVPLAWTELKDFSSAPRFRVADFAEWKDRLRHDPWKEMQKTDQQLMPQVLEAYRVKAS